MPPCDSLSTVRASFSRNDGPGWIFLLINWVCSGLVHGVRRPVRGGLVPVRAFLLPKMQAWEPAMVLLGLRKALSHWAITA